MGVILYAMLAGNLPFEKELLTCPRFAKFGAWARMPSATASLLAHCSGNPKDAMDMDWYGNGKIFLLFVFRGRRLLSQGFLFVVGYFMATCRQTKVCTSRRLHERRWVILSFWGRQTVQPVVEKRDLLALTNRVACLSRVPRLPPPSLCSNKQPGLPVVVFPATFQLCCEVPSLRTAAP